MKNVRFHRANRITRSLAILGLAAAYSVASAGESASQYEMTVVYDAAHGRTIAAGDPARAIERLTSRVPRTRDAFVTQNNLCVAYARTGRLDDAREACGAALALAGSDQDAPSAAQDRLSRRYHAMVLSNRGVVNAMVGQEEAAREDFVAAVDLGSDLTAPTRNLDLLGLR